MRSLRILEAYREVADLGSVTAAARALGVSQPAVSRMIQELERELGQSLFQRVGQRLVLTPQGMALRDDVDRALGGISELWERAREIGREAAPPIRVSAVSALAFGLLPQAWRGIEAQGLRLTVRVETPDQVQSDVVSGAARLGATSAPLLHRDLTVEWLGTAPCVLAVPEGDPLATGDGPVALRELAGHTLIGMSWNRGVGARIRAALRAEGVEPNAAIRTNSTINALSFIRTGAGVAIIEPLTTAGMPVPGVRVRPLDTVIPYVFGVVTARVPPGCDRVAGLVRGLADAAAALRDFGAVPPADHQAFLADLAKREHA